MKKVSLFTGVFMVLFLAIGAYTAHAQDLSGLNGQWLNGILKAKKGWVTSRSGATAVPEKMQNVTEKFYACVRAGGGSVTLFMFDKEGTPIVDFRGGIGLIAGTNDAFVGELMLDKAEKRNYGFVYVKDGKFQSINGYGYYSGADEFTTYDFVFNGKILKKVPSNLEAVDCATYSP